MTRRKLPSLLPLLLSLLALSPVGGAQPVDYASQVKPILEERCASCHGTLRQEAGLRVDAAALLRKGSEQGQVIVPGDAKESLLIHRIDAEDADERMPPEGKPLSAEQIVVLRTWIDQGAVAPRDEPIPQDPRQHWAFQPPQRPEVPNVPRAHAHWIRSPIDHFIAAEHQRQGLSAAEEAPRSLLLRRVYLDLIGLPPTRSQLQAFLNDQSPGAYERAVDQLLDSPRYGERWARHWMDVWRYSDPSGYGKEIRDSREHIWRWRDWIVDSLNADKSYDRMIAEMLAADELAPDDPQALRGTGFLARNWYKFNRNVELDNVVEHSAKAMLGLTINCARCHDHKYDPIGHHEYYQLRAIFEPHEIRDDPFPEEPHVLVRAFDLHADTPTYVFLQGDERRADKEHAVAPAVPDLFDRPLNIEPVELPVTAYYPALQIETQQAKILALDNQVVQSKSAVTEAEQRVKRSQKAFASFQPASESVNTGDDVEQPAASNVPADETDAESPTVLSDSFSQLDADRWKIESGNWMAIDGRLVQDHGDTKQYRLLSRMDHPRDFHAQLRLQITGGEMWRSVGFGFDCHDGQTMNAVYVSAYAGGSKLQVTTQNASGQWAYPSGGAKAVDVQLNEEYLLEVMVRDRLMHVLLDGEPLVDFALPADREPGKLAIWTFSATARFDEIQVKPLSPDVKLPGSFAENATAQPSTRQSLETELRDAEAEKEIAALELAATEAKRESLVARYAAERVKYGLDKGDGQMLAHAAGRAERRAELAKLAEQVARDRQKLAAATRQPPTDEKAKGAVAAIRKELAAHEKQWADAQAGVDNDSDSYQPLGAVHPKTSTGRRLALARWITDRRNPLAARVVVNHIWLRHFGEPLVERVFDFGLRSPRPRHAELLDWLAVQFMEDGWSMKRLHKRIVMSGTYRFSSSNADAAAVNRQVDPDNLYLWRSNPRRMEAEAVRDSILHIGGQLDLTMGGPPLEHTQGQSTPRRSLYFRHDKERQMTFLNLFDGAKVNECYRRTATVAPQQALAMYNSRIAADQSRQLADRLSSTTDEQYVTALFESVLCRLPTAEEADACRVFLAEPDSVRARQQLALVLLNHNDFVTVR